MADCIFCQILAGKIPARTVDEGERWIAFHDVSPQAPTHILIVPREHIPTLDDLLPGDSAAPDRPSPAGRGPLAGELVLAALGIARREGLVESGYRLVWNCGEGGGQSVFHIHLHLLGGRRMEWPPG